MRIGFIGGTSSGLALEGERRLVSETPYGSFEAVVGSLAGIPDREIVFVRRHGVGHERLSSSVAHRVNIHGLREAGVTGVIATTVCGVLDPALGLGRAIVFDDLYFPDNRLPDGSPCTFFDEPGRAGRGHFIFSGPFSPSLRAAAIAAADAAGLDVAVAGTYAYSLGPRFNTKAEIRTFHAAGACAVSQTAGPEAVLAGELELPYCLVGFGVDFANGVTDEPTPVETLDANIALSASAFTAVVSGAAADWQPPANFDTGFVYRF